jgi:hypothetical protein
MNIYLVQEFSRADYDFSTDIKHYGLYVNRDEAIAKAKSVFESLKQKYADEIDRYTRKEDTNFDEDGEVEFYIDDEKGRYEFNFGSEEDYELFSVTVEEIELGSEAHVIHQKCKRESLSDDIQNKAWEMDIDLEGKDLEHIVDKVEHGLDNNESLWESYWLTIENVLEEI